MFTLTINIYLWHWLVYLPKLQHSNPVIICLCNFENWAFRCTPQTFNCRLYHTNHLSQNLCLTWKACHQLYTLRSAVRSQNGGMRPWEVYAVHLLVLYSSTPIIPLLLCSPCKVHWMMGNTVYLWQIWVALLAVLQDISLYVSLTQMHLEQCFPQNEILSVSVADWKQ